MCRGRRDSRDGRNIQSPPVVIGEEQIDNMSDLWKDEDKATLYEYANGRSEPHRISYYRIILLACVMKIFKYFQFFVFFYISSEPIQRQHAYTFLIC